MDLLLQQANFWSGVTLIFIMLCTTATNGLLLYAMYKNPLRCFRNSVAVVVASLSIADILTGAVTALDVGITSILLSRGIPPIQILGTPQDKLVSQFSVSSGIYVVVVLSSERFLAVIFPFIYRRNATPKKALVICIVCFAFGLICSLSELALEKAIYVRLSFYVVFVAPLLILVLTNVAVYIALEHYKRKQTNSVADQRQHLRSQRQRKLVVMTFYIVLGFLFSYCFWFTVVLIGNICPSCKLQSWYSACYRISIPFLYVNSALNPLMYAWRMPRYRRSLLLVIRRNVRAGPREPTRTSQATVIDTV